MESIEFKEVVELFINKTVYELINESETPRVNFIFSESAYQLFNEVMQNPFIKKGSWTPNIKEQDILNLQKMENCNYPTIFVKDHFKFFNYLMEITNNMLKLYNYYGEKINGRELLIYIMRRIWLRMNVNDFNNVEFFLHNQLEFTKSNLLDEYIKGKRVDDFYDYSVVALSDINRTWDESTRSMTFRIDTKGNYHTLPNIFYDIIDNTCYIYAIQNHAFQNIIPEIDKLIYKVYRGNGQPRMVYALKLFINLLKENGITNIKIPTIQVLSYHYHELLSEKVKKEFLKKWSAEELQLLNSLKGRKLERKLEEYEWDKNWYNHIVDKEDLISKIKTENLINLIYRVVKEGSELELISDIFVDDTIIVKINNKLIKKL